MMLGYYLRLALKSFARDPVATALALFAISIGIGVCVTTLTIYRTMAGNPIWWKNDRLYAVTMDSWTPERPAYREQPQLPPAQLTYNDATYLFSSNIPERKVLSYPVAGVIMTDKLSRPLKLRSRVATADFFPMFDVPFRYGGGWRANADTAVEPVIVLSHDLNDRLFGGENSVGRVIRWNYRDFRIIGVLAQWQPRPRFYDLNQGHFNEPEAAYVPWGWGKALQLRVNGQFKYWKVEKIDTFERLLGSEVAWIQMWVELPDADGRARMQAFIDTYWSEQRKTGRFQRPRNNRLTPVDQWLRDNQVVQDDNRLLVVLAFAFLGVCLLNTVGLLLAKFLRGAASAGVRRALGASRIQIFNQHLVQAGILALAGSLVGLGLSAFFLLTVRTLFGDVDAGNGGYQSLARFEFSTFVLAMALAAAAVVVTGAYPAWRIGRVPPAVYLKSQ
jgi:putative ABC transport system permease protein